MRYFNALFPLFFIYVTKETTRVHYFLVIELTDQKGFFRKIQYYGWMVPQAKIIKT